MTDHSTESARYETYTRPPNDAAPPLWVSAVRTAITGEHDALDMAEAIVDALPVKLPIRWPWGHVLRDYQFLVWLGLLCQKWIEKCPGRPDLQANGIAGGLWKQWRPLQRAHQGGQDDG